MAVPRIIIGLDYGITDTGLAWAEIRDESVFPLSNIVNFRRWPGEEGRRVPSEYSYSESANGRRQWGYSIDDNSLVLRRTKLDLEPRTTEKELEVLAELVKGLDLFKEFERTGRNAPRHLTKRASDVVRDYLVKVVQQWHLHITHYATWYLKIIPLHVIITHPAHWSYGTLNKFYRAVMAAFSESLFPTLERVYFMLEPEACALYMVEDLSSDGFPNSLAVGNCFILCDAGEDTVDTVSYLIESLIPLKIKRISQATGRQCGATCVDRAFLEWLDSRIEGVYVSRQDVIGSHSVPTLGARLILYRFQSIKNCFRGKLHQHRWGENLDEYGPITMPRGTFVKAGHEESIINRIVSISEQDLRQMFSKSVDESIELIRGQVMEIRNQGQGETHLEATHIFLTGSFAESPYLFEQVENYARMNGLILRRAGDCFNGVAKGAVLAGVGLGAEMLVKITSCPRHYGFCVDMPYSNWKHNNIVPNKSEYGHDPMVYGQVVWLIRKRDAIFSNNPIYATLPLRHRFSKNYSTAMKLSVRFVATTTEPAPTDISKFSDETSEIMILEAGVEQCQCCIKWYQAPGLVSHNIVDLDVELRVDSSQVTATLRCNCKALSTYTTAL